MPLAATNADSLTCADCHLELIDNAYDVRCPKCGGLLELDCGAALTQNAESPTPLFLAERLSERLGVEVWCKDETVHPTGTWKDREGIYSVARAIRSGVKNVVMFSSGNAGTAIARAFQMAKGSRLHIVMPESSRDRLWGYQRFFRDTRYVDIRYFPGSNDECAAEAVRFAKEHGYASEGGFFNVARREGLKTFALEVAQQRDEDFDWYVQAVAGGLGVYAYDKAARDLRAPCPQILGVQHEVCAPFVNGWHAGLESLEEWYVPQEVAKSEYCRVLRTRRPEGYSYVKKVVDRVGGRFEVVNDGQVHGALRAFYLDGYYRDQYRIKGTIVGLEPATALAGLTKGVREGYVQKGARVLLNVSGAAKRGDVKMEWIEDLL